MTVTFIEGTAAVLMYLFGGALVLFIYEAYKKTGQRSLIFMAIGFFVLIFGGNLTTLAAAIEEMSFTPGALDQSAARTLSLVIQLIGIVLLIISATRPFGRKE
ncbi:MAG: hypothetical protein A4E28_02522 [Methanocella sp. PtaU1.Bin125]|nr:MAG: hypothetical protein A4E28_02522 [Methanocella sp. PtaU1.Bin125]